MDRAPWRRARAQRAAASERTPVEVSAWTKARTLAGPEARAASTAATSTGSPQGASTRTTSAPARPAMSTMRPPKTPLTAITTRSPGSSRFIRAASMPAVPGAGRGTQAWSGALKRRARAALISSIRSWKAGSRWPTVGRDRAASTRGLTSEGPGPMRIRLGGWKLCISPSLFGARRLGEARARVSTHDQRKGGSSKLRSFRECRPAPSRRSRSTVARPIWRCWPMARS